MNLGIKSGLLGNSLQDIAQTHPDFTEIWFNVTNSDAYEPLFEGLKKLSVPAALHFWGITNDGLYPTWNYPDQALIDESYALYTKAIDIAARHNSPYVNIHPGVAGKTQIDFHHKTFHVTTDPIAPEISQALFFEYIQKLNHYANERNVLLTVETVPMCVVTPWHGDRHTKTTFMHELSIDTLYKAATAYGIAIANDFGHTTGNIITKSQTEAWHFLQTQTERFAPYTKLVHVSFLEAPFNGTDFHDHLDNKHFLTGQSVPTYPQMQTLLQLFINRKDVYALVEPPKDHVKNFILLQKIVQSITKN